MTDGWSRQAATGHGGAGPWERPSAPAPAGPPRPPLARRLSPAEGAAQLRRTDLVDGGVWWSDPGADRWRDANAPAEIVIRPVETKAPPMETEPDPTRP